MHLTALDWKMVRMATVFAKGHIVASGGGGDTDLMCAEDGAAECSIRCCAVLALSTQSAAIEL